MKNNTIEIKKRNHIKSSYNKYLNLEEPETITLSTFIRYIRETVLEQSLSFSVRNSTLSTSFLSRLENADTNRLSLDKVVAISNDLDIDFLFILKLIEMEIKSINLGMIFEMADKIYYGDYLLDSSMLDLFIETNLENLIRK